MVWRMPATPIDLFIWIIEGRRRPAANVLWDTDITRHLLFPIPFFLILSSASQLSEASPSTFRPPCYIEVPRACQIGHDRGDDIGYA